MKIIELENVSKVIKNNTVLDDISMSLREGHIYGLIGKNGSGKTMLLRMLALLISPSSGEVNYVESHEEDTKITPPARIGITIENPTFYPSFTGLRNLMFLASINKYIGESEVRIALKNVGLDPDDKRTVKRYSLGMKQRLSIAQAIMENPDYLFLDEPTNALDVEGIPLIQNLIRKQAVGGSVVVIASHSKEDVDLLCDKLFYMADGKIVTEKVTANGVSAL